LKLLLEFNADPNARDDYKNTPLHVVGFSRSGSIEDKEKCCEILMWAVNALNNQSQTPLDFPAVQLISQKRPYLFNRPTSCKTNAFQINFNSKELLSSLKFEVSFTFLGFFCSV
jgi:hypothetical protein